MALGRFTCAHTHMYIYRGLSMQLRLHGYRHYKRHTLTLCVRCISGETLVQITLGYREHELHKNARLLDKGITHRECFPIEKLFRSR